MTIIAMLFALLFGIIPEGPAPDPVPPRTHSTDVHIAVGETTRVVLGQSNPSIGDSYYITDGADSPLATIKEGHDGCPDDSLDGGCSFPVYADVTGRKEGTFTFTVQYCLRTTLENCDAQGKEPVVYTVTVTK
ncbi:hypothetical protein [uncultured Tessaracoccus sp.]|uniref:hypothetical protein n=1 Tax=uncultured Tessaracoccus sp. TaxID=905023 RepID=UPI0026104DC7|nr:hypothetical protein [uncultured Tessaracoccus sp.]